MLKRIKIIVKNDMKLKHYPDNHTQTFNVHVIRVQVSIITKLMVLFAVNINTEDPKKNKVLKRLSLPFVLSGSHGRSYMHLSALTILQCIFIFCIFCSILKEDVTLDCLLAAERRGFQGRR